MKKHLFLFFLILLPFFSYSEVKSDIFFFYIAPKSSITFGKLGEYLYTSANDRVISYLEWEEKPLIYAGGELGFSFFNLSVSFNGFYAVSDSCGKMYDSDWNIPDVKTNYGTFTNHNNNSWYASAKIDYRFDITPLYSLSPVFQFKYRYDSFSTDKGKGWYADEENSSNDKNESWDSEYAKECNLSGIDYYRKNLFYYVGLEQSLHINKTDISLNCLICPHLAIFTQDTHRDDFAEDEEDSQTYSTITLHKDSFKLFLFELSCNYMVRPKLKLYLSSSFEILNKTSGQTATNKNNGKHFGFLDGEWMLLKQKSTVDFKELSISAGCKISF